MKKPLLKWLMMGLMFAMFSVAQVSAIGAEMPTVQDFAEQYMTANPEASLTDVVGALMTAGYDEDTIQAGLEAAGYSSNNISAAMAAAKKSTVIRGPSSGDVPPIAPAPPPATGGGGSVSPN